MKYVIEILRNQHDGLARFNRDDEWYVGVLKGRKHEDKTTAGIEERIAHRKIVMDEIEDAIETLEESKSG